MNAMWQMWQQRYNKDLCQKIVEEASKIEPQDVQLPEEPTEVEQKEEEREEDDLQ